MRDHKICVMSMVETIGNGAYNQAPSNFRFRDVCL